MSNFFKGFVAASSIFGILGFGAVLLADNDARIQVSEMVTDLVNQYCNVTVSYGWRRSGDTCSFNRVMTGYDGEYIYCSDVQVSCNL